MKILNRRRIKGFDEALTLALEESGSGGVSAESIGLFVSTLDINRLGDEADRSIKSAIYSRYGKKATWYGDRWFVPIPHLSFNIEPDPQLAITIQPYLVSQIKVVADYNTYSLAIVGAIGKPVDLNIPMSFLSAIVHEDLGRFKLVNGG